MPLLQQIMFQLTANLAMRWIVDCDIVYDKTDKTGKTQLVKTCGFRKSLGNRRASNIVKFYGTLYEKSV